MKQKRYLTIAHIVANNTKTGPACKAAERTLKRMRANRPDRRALRTYLWGWLEDRAQTTENAKTKA
jgi:hypothetical protein